MSVAIPIITKHFKFIYKNILFKKIPLKKKGLRVSSKCRKWNYFARSQMRSKAVGTWHYYHSYLIIATVFIIWGDNCNALC